MKPIVVRPICLAIVLTISACPVVDVPDSGGNNDGGSVIGGDIDGGRIDAGDIDAGRMDGGDIDAGDFDAGDIDGGSIDGGFIDGGVIDGGVIDGGRVDGGFIDGGRVDGGRIDGGSVDGGSTDSGPVGNNAPTALQLDITTSENEAISGNFIDESGSFDADDGDSLTVQTVAGTPVTVANQLVILQTGSRLLISPNGDFTYIPTFGAYQALSAGASDQDVIAFVLSDFELTATADLVVTVVGVNDAPTASPLFRTTNENEQAFNVDLLANVDEIDDADVLNIQNFAESITNFGSFQLNGTTFVFDASVFDGLNGGDSEVVNYTYDVVDSEGARVSTTFELTVEGRD